jgi:rfaE bifunctional protein nucleotidyltransferase chain/domain
MKKIKKKEKMIKGSAVEHFTRGLEFQKADRYQEAIFEYNEAIRIEPSFAKAYNNSGVAKDGLGQYEEAIKDFEEAINLNPAYSKAYNNRGVAKGGLGQYEEAIKDYDEAIRLKPLYADVYNNRGIAKAALSRYEEAIKDFEEAINLNPACAEAYNNRGVATMKLGRDEEAINDYDEAIRLNTAYSEAYNNRGIAKAKLGRDEEAIMDYNEAIRLNTAFSEAYYNSGAVKAKLGRLRAEGKKIVFTNGCFDILHVGHVRYLNQARALGDALVVAVNSDSSVGRLKPDRPIVPENERAEVLAALSAVDFVVIFNEDTPYEIIKTLGPDILVKGGDWKREDIVGGDLVADTRSLPYVENFSTTAIIERILKARG